MISGGIDNTLESTSLAVPPETGESPAPCVERQLRYGSISETHQIVRKVEAPIFDVNEDWNDSGR
jgi:hypothetical protein